MNGLGEYRSATIDGLPWQIRLLPTGHCNIREENTRARRVAPVRLSGRMAACDWRQS